MAYRNKTYIAFDADTDMDYYNLLKGWKANHFMDFDFYDAHDLNNLWERSNEDTIKRKLRERMNNTKLFVLLVGEKTRYLYRFVRWEIEIAIKLDIPIIVVNLNGLKRMDSERCPAIAKNTLAIHIPFKAKIIKYAMDNWPSSYTSYKKQDKNCAYIYKESVYKELRL